MSTYLICYDIADPRRLQRMYRCLLSHAFPLQYSVFLLEGDERQLTACLAEARALIKMQEDDLRAYPLPARGLKRRLGAPLLPLGILWSGLPLVFDGPANSEIAGSSS